MVKNKKAIFNSNNKIIKKVLILLKRKNKFKPIYY